MVHKKKLSEEEFMLIMERALAAADMPALDVEFEDGELNLDWGVLPPITRVALVKPTETKDAPVSEIPVSGTCPVCIRIPASVIHAFKAQAEKTGGRYQAIMNRTLRAAAASFL